MSTSTTEFDVLIVGGGPAGLLLGSLAANPFRIALCEKSQLGKTTKYWITSRHRLAAHGLDDCINASFSSALFGTFLGTPVVVPGDFAVAAEDRVLQKLVTRARSADVTLFEHCPVTALRWERGYLRATTPQGQISARIVIDASGGGSPIAATFRLHSLDGFYTVYGQHLINIRAQSAQLVAGYVPSLGDPPTIFEIMPTSENTVICSAFVVTSQAKLPESLRPALDQFVKNNEFFLTTTNTAVCSERSGVIPIGRLSHRRLSRVIGFGEAGMMQSPLLGGAFNEMLVHVHGFAASLRRILSRSSASGELRIVASLTKRANDRLQSFLATALIDEGVVRLQQLVDALERIGPRCAYRLLASELALYEIPLVALGALKPPKTP